MTWFDWFLAVVIFGGVLAWFFVLIHYILAKI
jgi:hypothetical protein